MRHIPQRLFGALILSLILSSPAEAIAYDRQLVLGGDLSYAHEFGDEKLPGGGAGLHLWYKISDYVALGFTGGWAGHVATNNNDETELRHVITAATGFFYILDVIRIIPYAGLLVGTAISIQDDLEAAYLLQVCGGADYLVNPSFLVGLEVAYQLIIGEDILPARLTASLRFSWRNIFF